MLPLLRLTQDGVEQPFREAVDRLAEEFELTDDERSELLPSGTAYIFGSRVGWARTYLKQAGLLEAPKRGSFRITAEGAALLARSPARIDNNLLNQYESFRAFRARGKEGEAGVKPASPTSRQSAGRVRSVGQRSRNLQAPFKVSGQTRASSSRPPATRATLLNTLT